MISKAPLEKAQIDGIKFATNHNYSICAMEMGLGKAQKISSTVYTPTGKVAIGSLKVGDYVFGQDGKAKKVLGIYPQGTKDIYEVEFNDGSKTHCCKEHIWRTQSARQIWRGKGSHKDHPLEKFMGKLFEKSGNSKYSIPQLSSPVDFIGSKLPIDPYVLGILIGDGSLKCGGITISNSNEHIYSKIKKLIPEYKVIRANRDTRININLIGKRRPHPFNVYLKSVGLNVKSKEKFIPDEYKYSKIEDRINLLCGLMDTDGYVAEDGTTQFSSASERLVNDVKELVQSLGGLARKNYKNAKCGDKYFDSWTLTINLPLNIKFISKPFKEERVKKNKKYLPRRYFKKVTYWGKEEAVCISVEDSLYLTDEFIVTHNTRTALEIAFGMGHATLVVCPASLILNWVAEIKKWYGDTKQITTIKKKTDIYPLWDTDICIISYENSTVADILFEWADYVIFDEGQYLKNMRAKRTEACHRMIYENSIKRMTILTGTPIKNRVEEYYSLIALCNYNPRIKESEFLKKFPDSITFADQFSHRVEFTMEVRGRYITVRRWEGLKNIDELKFWLKDIYYRAKGVPGTFVVKEVIIGDEDDEELAEELEAMELGRESVAGPAKMMAANKMVLHTIKYAEDILDEVGQVVIYSDHVEPAEKIAQGLGIKPITGKMKMEERMQIVDRFQRGELKALVATIPALSTGVTLTAASNMIFNDPCWSAGDLLQTQKRIDRLGQTKLCVYHRMIGSIQQRKIYEVLENKMKVIDAAT